MTLEEQADYILEHLTEWILGEQQFRQMHDVMMPLIVGVLREAVLEEREACATLAETMTPWDADYEGPRMDGTERWMYHNMCERISKAIRARGTP